MFIKCENCGKQWIDEHEYAYIAPFCSIHCVHSSEYKHEVKKAHRLIKSRQLTDAERKQQELIDHPEFLEID